MIPAMLLWFVAFLGFPGSAAGAVVEEPSLQPSFEISGEGLGYELYGESMISQSRLSPRVAFTLDNLPRGAVVVRAFLYWSGELEPSRSADTSVELRGPDGEKTVVRAGKVRTLMLSGLVYASRAEISGLIKKKGSYEISHIDADPLEEKKTHYTLGGWALIVVFKDPHARGRSDLQIHDGLLYVPGGAIPGATAASARRVVKLRPPKGDRVTAVDVAVIAGLGRPWDGGSLRFDGTPLSGKEDFVGSSGFSWDLIRSWVALAGKERPGPHELEFVPDYNGLLPLAVVAKFGAPRKDEILRLAASYVRQADEVEHRAFFDVKDSGLEDRELSAKQYIRGILFSKAIDLFHEVDKMGLQDPKGLHVELGELYLSMGKLDLAEIEFKEAGADFQLGRLYYEKGDLDQAIAHLTDAQRSSGGDPLIAQNLGMCFLQRGFLDRAAEQFEKASRLDPKSLTSWRCLSKIYQKQGKAAQEACALEKIKEIESAGRK